MSYPLNLTGSGISAAAATQICGTVQDNVTATGTGQSDAFFSAADHIIVTTAAAGTGVRLPAAQPGAEVTVKNLGANAVLVYPATGGTINALAANAGFSIAAASQARFLGRNSTGWVTY